MTLVSQFAERALRPSHGAEEAQRTRHLPHAVLQLTGHTGAVNECRFAPSGRVLGSCANEIMLWTCASDGVSPVGALRPHSAPVTSIAWSIDGGMLASASADRTVAVLDAESGKVVRRLRGHRDIVNCVEFSREAPELVLSGDDSGFVLVDDIRCRESVGKLKSNSPVVDVAVSGDMVAVAGVDGNAYVNRLIDAVGDGKKLKLQNMLSGSAGDIAFGVDFDPKRKYVAVNYASGDLRVFSIQAVYEGRDRLMSCVRGGLETKEIVPSRVVFSPNGKYVMCGSSDKMLKIWDVENVQDMLIKYELPGHRGAVTGVDFHPELPIVVSGSTDGTLIMGELKEYD